MYGIMIHLKLLLMDLHKLLKNLVKGHLLSDLEIGIGSY